MSTLTRIKGIVFDLGGTLYRPAVPVLPTIRRFLDENGLNPHHDMDDTELTSVIDMSADRWLDEYAVQHNVHKQWEPTHDLWLEYDRLLLRALGVTDGLEELTRQYQSMWDDLIARIQPKLVGGVREALEELVELGCRLGIASNRFGDPSRFLRVDEIEHFFDAVEFSNVPGYKKPSPYMLLSVARTLKLNPRTCAYVGNLVEYDVRAAVAAEMKPVILTWVEANDVSQAPDGTAVFGHINELVQSVRFGEQSEGPRLSSSKPI